MSRIVIASALVIGLTLCAPCAGATFNFDLIAPATTTPFTSVDSGVTATFSSPGGSVFSVQPAFFNSLSGNAVLDADSPLNALDIAFSTSMSSITLNFALNSQGLDTMTLVAYSGGVGGTIIGTSTVAGIIPPGFTFPEGTIRLLGSAFDAVRITSTARDFAVDNIIATPEPASVGLVLIGLLACVFAPRRR